MIFFQDFAESSISYLVSLVDESFSANDTSSGVISELSEKCRDVSQNLLNYYVRVEGLKISQVGKKGCILKKGSVSVIAKLNRDYDM